MERIPTPPVYAPGARRVAELPFFGTVAAAGWLTIVTARIPYPFRITKVKMFFTQDAYDRIFHSWHVGPSTATPPGGPSTDPNIFARESPVSRFIGHAIIRVVDCDLQFAGGENYIKISTENTGPYAYEINAACVIEAM